MLWSGCFDIKSSFLSIMRVGRFWRIFWALKESQVYHAPVSFDNNEKKIQDKLSYRRSSFCAIIQKFIVSFFNFYQIGFKEHSLSVFIFVGFSQNVSLPALVAKEMLHTWHFCVRTLVFCGLVVVWQNVFAVVFASVLSYYACLTLKKHLK